MQIVTQGLTNLAQRPIEKRFLLLNGRTVSVENLFVVKDTRREKAPSNKTPALTKSTNIGIWVVGTSNQLLIRGS